MDALGELFAALSEELDNLLNKHFSGKVVRKDLTKKIKEGANVPVYVLEYLLGQYCASTDDAIIEDGMKTVKRVLADNYVRPDESEKIKSIVREKGGLKVIDKVTVTLNAQGLADLYAAGMELGGRGLVYVDVARGGPGGAVPGQLGVAETAGQRPSRREV